MVQGFWAEAAVRQRRMDLAMDELSKWTAHIRRDNQCDEMYHPETGRPYGGLNDWADGTIHPHTSASRQTWSATAYLRLFLFGLLGMRFSPQGLSLHPNLPEGLDWIEVHNLPYRKALLTIRVEGCGDRISLVRLDGQAADQATIPAQTQGEHHWTLTVNR